jgi:hypothetical protein
MKEQMRTSAFIGLPMYRVEVEVDQDGVYEAFIPTLGRNLFCAAADSMEAALDELRRIGPDIKSWWIHQGRPFPPPDDKDRQALTNFSKPEANSPGLLSIIYPAMA